MDDLRYYLVNFQPYGSTMKLITSLKIGCVLTAALSSAWMMKPTETTVAQCQTLIQTQFDGQSSVNLQCAQVAEPSWSSWLTGKSRSTQFHFIDLVELLGQLKPATDQQ